MSKPPTARKRNRQRVLQGAPWLLSKPASDYIKLLADPASAPLTGIPCTPVFYSGLQRVHLKGTATSGTAGVGFVVLSPQAAIAKDNIAVEASTALYAGTKVDCVAAAGTAGFLSNSSWVTANIGDNAVTYRVVAACLRLINDSTALNVEGNCTGLLEPNHSTLDQLDQPALLAYDEAETLNARKMLEEYHQVIYRPVKPNDLDFLNTVTNINAAQDGGCMAFLFTNKNANPQTYYFEAYVVFEALGPPVRNKTMSSADQVGHDAAHTVVAASRVMSRVHAVSADLGATAVRAANGIIANHMSGAQRQIAGAPRSEQAGAESPEASVNRTFAEDHPILSGFGSILGAIGRGFLAG